MKQLKSRCQTKRGPGRMHSNVQSRRKDKQFASEHGVAEPLRRYAKRYGVDAITVAQTRTKADSLIASRRPA